MNALGEWELVEELGRGAMGVVWRARHMESGQEAALKLAGELYGEDEEARLRFEREVATLTQLRHPSVVRALDAGRDGSGRPWLAQELVEGETLRARLQRGPLEPEVAARIAASLARGLAAAHAVGIVHRDVKPENVMLRPDGEPVLLDFGLARALGRATQLTRTGEILGTPAYMAPEQVAGSPTGVGPPADVYGLGATLYAALCGEPPFTHASAVLCLEAVLKHAPPPLSTRRAGLDPELARICDRCLAKDPGGRWPDANALAEALEGWLEGSSGRPRLPRSLVVLAGLSFLAALAAIALAKRGPQPEPPVAAPVAPPSPVATVAASPVAPPAARELPEAVVHDEVHEGLVLLGVHPNGSRFVSVGQDQQHRASLWEGLRRGESVYLTERPASLATTRSGWWVATQGRLLRYGWSGEPPTSFLLPPEDQDFTPIRLAISPDESLAVGVSSRPDLMEVRLFELGPTPRRRWKRELEGRLIRALIAFAPRGEVLVGRGPQDMAMLDRTDPGGWLFVLSPADGTDQEIVRLHVPLALDSDRRGRVLMGTAAGGLFLFTGAVNEREHEQLRVFQPGDDRGTIVDQPIGGCAFAGPDHAILVVADSKAENRRLEVWDIAGKRRLALRDLPRFANPSSFACDPEGRWVALGTRKGQVLTWDLEGVLRR